jgi:hypothetical protein
MTENIELERKGRVRFAIHVYGSFITTNQSIETLLKI